MVAILMLLRAKSWWRFLIRYQQLTPTTNEAPSPHDEVIVWKNLLRATGDRATAQKSIISFLIVSGLNSIPTGYCIQALATRIQNAERVAPSVTSQVDAKCIFLLTRSQPKNMIEINVASRKKATIPSMARGAPKISPTNRL